MAVGPHSTIVTICYYCTYGTGLNLFELLGTTACIWSLTKHGGAIETSPRRAQGLHNVVTSREAKMVSILSFFTVRNHVYPFEVSFVFFFAPCDFSSLVEKGVSCVFGGCKMVESSGRKRERPFPFGILGFV